MAKLYFRYGTMNSGKSIDILKTVHNYEEQGKKVMLFTSSIDNRHGVGKVTSRIGKQREAMIANEQFFDQVKASKPNCVIVDETQFLHPDVVDLMAKVADELNIPVIAYGLRTDFQTHLFEGSRRLFELADKIEEVKTVCWYCDKKALMNMRMNEQGQPVFEGDQILIGGNDSYIPVCRKCFYERVQ